MERMMRRNAASRSSFARAPSRRILRFACDVGTVVMPIRPLKPSGLFSFRNTFRAISANAYFTNRIFPPSNYYLPRNAKSFSDLFGNNLDWHFTQHAEPHWIQPRSVPGRKDAGQD